MIKKLNEDTSLKFKNISPEEKSKKGILGRLYGPVASFAAPTRNGRHYSQDLWEKLFNSDLIKERFNNGGIFGELCHPDYEDVNMEKIAVVMPEPPVKDNKGNLIAYVDIVDTPCGRIAYQLAKYGYKFGISSRGTGDIIEDYNGNEEVDPDTYQLNAFDLVEIPAVESARLAFVESLDTKKIYNKTLKQKLTEELDKASDEDKQIMKDSLKNLDIDLDEDAADGSVEDYLKKMQEGDPEKVYRDAKGNPNAEKAYRQLKGLDEDIKWPKEVGDDYDFRDEDDDVNDDLDEKLVEPSEEDLKPIEAKFAELGLDIEGKGDTLFGNKHYQLRKELDHKVTKEDLGPIFDALCDLSTDNMPTTCNVGVHRDGDNIISASLDVLKKHIPDNVEEELEDEDGWGEEIQDHLEPVFSDLEALIYEVRNCVRGSYAVKGKEIEDLEAAFDAMSERLEDISIWLAEDEDRLNEDLGPKLKTNIGILKNEFEEFLKAVEAEDTKGIETHANNIRSKAGNISASLEFSRNLKDSDEKFKKNVLGEGIPVNSDQRYQLMGKLDRLNTISKVLLDYFVNYDYDSEDSDTVKTYLNDTLENLQELCAKFNDTTNESCSDKEVEESKDAGNSGDLVDQLQEALLKNGELKKDNLSLQEKLSVCNAKELKLNEELSKYKKASANLSQTSKRIRDLEEELDSKKKDLDYKDKLIESKNGRLANLIKSRKESTSKLEESVSKVKELENQVKQLNSQLKDKDNKLSESSARIVKYQRALKESKERYIDIKTSYLGISKEELKTKLKESYSYKDIDSVCDELSDEKRNLSKLPFRINENAKLNFKSSKNEYIRGGQVTDDEVSDYLLSILH